MPTLTKIVFRPNGSRLILTLAERYGSILDTQTGEGYTLPIELFNKILERAAQKCEARQKAAGGASRNKVAPERKPG